MIRPLTGQCLIEMLPPELSPGGLHIVEWKGQGNPPVKAIVRAMGHWPAAPNGLHHLPEFHVGQTVLVSKHGGQQLHRDFGGKFKLVKQSAVMAVVSEQ